MTTYAVNKYTKEHVFDFDPDLYQEWDFVSADADGWIPWSGGECPLPEGERFDVELRGGEPLYNESASDNWSWHHGFGRGDIIAYRPILDADDEPEEADWDGDGPPPAGAWVETDYGGAEVALGPDADGFIIVEASAGVWRRVAWCDVRPIRTAEDRAVEEMESLIPGEECDIISTKEACRALYRAGYRKEK